MFALCGWVIFANRGMINGSVSAALCTFLPQLRNISRSRTELFNWLSLLSIILKKFFYPSEHSLFPWNKSVAKIQVDHGLVYFWLSHFRRPLSAYSCALHCACWVYFERVILERELLVNKEILFLPPLRGHIILLEISCCFRPHSVPVGQRKQELFAILL